MPPSTKIKARNVIPGWPRGHSTTVAYHNERWKYDTACHPFRHTSIGMSYQYANDADYHRDQSIMLDRHISEYRRPTPAWLARKMMAVGLVGCGVVIATCGETPDTLTLGEPDRPWSFNPTATPATDKAEEAESLTKRYLYTNFIVDHHD